MPEKPKKEPNTVVDEDDLAEDQKKHVYYYDDAHGYEPYEPEKDEESEAEEKCEGEV